MKRVIRFSKYFVPAAALSAVLIVLGIAGYFFKGGFNLGVDFQAGLLQEVQFAPQALSLRYTGLGNASVSVDRNGIEIVLSGSNVEGAAHRFPFSVYGTLGELRRALDAVDGLSATAEGPDSVSSLWLIQNTRSNPQLSSEVPYVLHYLSPDAPEIDIRDVRMALLSLGTVSVQELGRRSERRFMIRMEDRALENSEEGDLSKALIASLEQNFGIGEVAVNRSDYVGSRFSKNLTQQAALLMSLTLLLILVYCSIRFKPQFAIGAVLAIIHDALIMVAFIIWTGLEFNTTTIAAILTILGYSVNDTIVILDRIREARQIHADEDFETILDRSLSETLSRTMITTLTTMLAVLSLFIFTTGSMKDFAAALLVGMISGVYSTIFIATGFADFWDKRKKKREQKQLSGGLPAKA